MGAQVRQAEDIKDNSIKTADEDKIYFKKSIMKKYFEMLKVN